MTRENLKQLWQDVLDADASRDEAFDLLQTLYGIPEDEKTRFMELNNKAEKASMLYYNALKKDMSWSERIAFAFGRLIPRRR